MPEWKQILEPQYPLEQLSIPNPDYFADLLPASTEDTKKIVGRKFPFIVIDEKVIKPIHISRVSISYGYKQLPILELVIRDTTGTYHNLFSSNTNKVLSLFVKGATDEMYLRTEFIITNVDSIKMKTNDNPEYNRYSHATTYHVVARLNAVGLYSTVYKALHNNIIDIYKAICGDLAFGLRIFGDYIYDITSDNSVVIYKNRPIYDWIYDIPSILYDDFYVVGINPDMNISIVLYDDIKGNIKSQTKLFSQFYDILYDIQQGIDSVYDLISSRFIFTNWEGLENTSMYIHKWEVINQDRTKFIESIQDYVVYRYNNSDIKPLTIGYGGNMDIDENIIPIKTNFVYDFGQPTSTYLFNKYNSKVRTESIINNTAIRISTSLYTNIHIGQLTELYIVDYTDTKPQDMNDVEPTSDMDTRPNINEDISGIYCVTGVEIEYKQARKDRQNAYVTHITAIKIN